MKFLLLEWKNLLRSAHIRQSMLITLLLGIFGLLIAIGLLAVGYTLYDLLDESSENLFPMQQVNRLLIFWFIGELALRFFMQQLPVMNVRPFLVQGISRSSLSHYLLAKSIFSFYNLLAPLVFISFSVACASAGDYSNAQLLAWLVAVLAISQTSHFTNFSIQHAFSANWKLASSLLGALALLSVLDYYNLVPISPLFAAFFEATLVHPVLCVFPVLFIFLSYLLLHRSLRQRLYLENNIQRAQKSVTTKNIRWINNFGRYAPLIRLDLKLLQRNKRSKSLLMTGIFGLFYGLIFYRNPATDSHAMLVFVGIFMTGLFTFNFGQFIPAWDSSYYPLINTQPIAIKDYLGAKSLLLYAAILISAILSIPYIYFGTEIFMINIASAIYNMGVNVPILLYFGSFNKKRVNLDQSQIFNYQGMGAAQWIVMLPALVIPVILWSCIRVFASFEITVMLFATIGIVGLCFRNLFLQRIAARYQALKHTMLAGFKQISE